MSEILDVTAGMDRMKANELSQSIMVRAEERLKQGQSVEHFTDNYDVETVKPKPEYEASLMKVKEDLARLGMPYY